MISRCYYLQNGDPEKTQTRSPQQTSSRQAKFLKNVQQPNRFLPSNRRPPLRSFTRHNQETQQKTYPSNSAAPKLNIQDQPRTQEKTDRDLPGLHYSHLQKTRSRHPSQPRDPHLSLLTMGAKRDSNLRVRPSPLRQTVLIHLLNDRHKIHPRGVLILPRVENHDPLQILPQPHLPSHQKQHLRLHMIIHPLSLID